MPARPSGAREFEDAPAWVLDLPAALHERHHGLERVEFLALRAAPGQIGVRAGNVCLGQGGSEGGNELSGRRVVETHAPDGRTESVAVRTDAPQAVVLPLGKEAEPDLVVGRIDVALPRSSWLSSQQSEQGLKSGIPRRGAASQVAG